MPVKKTKTKTRSRTKKASKKLKLRGVTVTRWKLAIFIIGFAIVGSLLLIRSFALTTEYTLLGNQRPVVVDAGATKPVELGMRFSSSVPGTVKGVRFYKSAANTGTHTGTLWSNGGTKKYATVTFTNETSSGWQKALFSNPVSINAGQKYIISYHTDKGHYSFVRGFFKDNITKGPLTALESTSTRGNGVFRFGGNAFPSNSAKEINYLVDVVFSPVAITSQTCPSGQTGTPPNCVTPPPVFASKCLARTGNKVTLSGLRKTGYKDQALTANTIFDATTLTWDGTSTAGDPIAWVTTFGGAGPACWYGGKYQGVWNDTDPAVTWSNPYHHSGIATIRNPDFLIEGFRADNNGDGIRMEGNANNFHIRAVYLSNMHDDCIENDHMNTGTIEDSLFDGCYSGISADHTNLTLDGSDNTMTFKNNLLYMKPMNTVFRGTVPGTAMLFKGWSIAGAPAPAMVIQNNIFRIDQKPGFESHNIPARMNIKSCSNNTIVWTGPGDFPYTYPSCFKVVKDVGVWNKAVADWKKAHPNIK